MNPRVKDVRANPDFTLTLTFTDGSTGRFDMRPYLGVGVFRELSDLALFRTVKPFMGSVQWKNGQDLCPDTLYEESVPESDAT